MSKFIFNRLGAFVMSSQRISFLNLYVQEQEVINLSAGVVIFIEVVDVAMRIV